MNPIIKNILALIVGWLVGSIINIGLIKIGHKILPIQGVDPNDMTAMAEVMPTLDAKYFIFPFLAHALGTLVGAFITYKIAVNYKMNLALLIGVFFLLGGIMMIRILPSPTWFTVVDIVLAYIPMAWIGGKLAEKN